MPQAVAAGLPMKERRIAGMSLLCGRSALKRLLCIQGEPHMVYVSVKQSVEDYKVWRPFFDNDDARRRTGGATGVNHVYRDAEKPNDVTVILEWDNKENAHKFTTDPALREVMQKAGVVGMPSVSILNRS